MGLNYVPRPVRRELDSPNQFITSAIGQSGDPRFYQFGEHETLVFIKEVLDKVEVDYQNIDLLGRN